MVIRIPELFSKGKKRKGVLVDFPVKSNDSNSTVDKAVAILNAKKNSKKSR